MVLGFNAVHYSLIFLCNNQMISKAHGVIHFCHAYAIAVEYFSKAQDAANGFRPTISQLSHFALTVYMINQ